MTIGSFIAISALIDSAEKALDARWTETARSQLSEVQAMISTERVNNDRYSVYLRNRTRRLFDIVSAYRTR